MTISGGRNDTIMNNNFVHNGSWGALFVPFPDTDTPPRRGHLCRGRAAPTSRALGFGCVFDTQNDALLNNTFSQNGFFGNPTNGDYGQITLTAGHPAELLRRQRDGLGVPGIGHAVRTWSRPSRPAVPITTARQHRRAAVQRGAVRLGPGRAPASARGPTTTRGRAR